MSILNASKLHFNMVKMVNFMYILPHTHKLNKPAMTRKKKNKNKAKNLCNSFLQGNRPRQRNFIVNNFFLYKTLSEIKIFRKLIQNKLLSSYQGPLTKNKERNRKWETKINLVSKRKNHS